MSVKTWWRAVTAAIGVSLVSLGTSGEVVSTRQGDAPEEILRVGQGETRVVTAEDRLMFVERWVMEDDSTIELADGVQAWRIYARSASFGDNVRVVGRGKDGLHGNQGFDGRWWAPRLATGSRAGDGTDATDGEDGKRIEIIMGLVGVGSLSIGAGGGNGGHGGRGGGGGKGGAASCSSWDRGANGGTGGNGGAAGAGGRGGEVSVTFWSVGAVLDLRGIAANVAGGTAGSPGNGGPGGPGADRRPCPPSGPFRGTLGTLAGGMRGRDGAPGRTSSPGQDGRYSLVQLATPLALPEVAELLGEGAAR